MKPTLTPARILRAIETASQVFEVPRREIVSRNRMARVSEARQAVYAALYRSCATSLPEIAQTFSRDHTTVRYGIQRIEKRADGDKEYETALVRIAQAVVQG